MIDKFWSKVSINMVAIGLPAIVSVLGISLLTRFADDNSAGSIMWTWFLMGSAAALNAGLHPSLTNELGQTSIDSPDWTELVAKYVAASNVIYLAISMLVVLWAIRNSEDGDVGVAVIQSILIWQTGISSLLMTALNYKGHAVLTAKSKIIFNTLIFALPVLTTASFNSLGVSLAVLVVAKLIQSKILFDKTIHLLNQKLSLRGSKFFGLTVMLSIIKRQWRMILISVSQMSFSLIDRFVVVSFFGVVAYKSYGAVLDILGLVWLVASVFIIQIHPIFANNMERISTKRKMTIHYSFWLSFIGGGGLAAIYFNMELFLSLVLNMEVTTDLHIIFRNLVFGLLCSLTYILINTLFISTGKQIRVLSISTVSLAAYSICVVPIINQFGMVGLSYMFLFKFIFEGACFHAYFLSDYFRKDLHV